MSNYGYFAQVYDSLTKNVEYEKRAEYIFSLLNQNGINSGIMLDLACGTGTLSKYFSDYGFDMILTDNSPDMLAKAKQKNPGALILCQDMTELDLYGTIDCAVCSLDSINHLTRILDVRKTFDKVSLFMNPGGIFIFDVNTVYKHRKILADNAFVYETDSSYCVWQNSLNKKTDEVSITLDIFTKEKKLYSRHTESFSERAYDIKNIKKWLEYSGFRIKSIFGEMTYEPAKEDDQRVYFVAGKI